MRSSPVFPYAAYLRVYEPLSAFPEPARSHWADYARADRAPGREAAVLAEHQQALENLLAVPLVLVPQDESRDALVIRVDGAVLVCPWQIRLRSWEALEEFRDGLPSRLVSAFLPPPALERAEADHTRWAATHPGEVPHILTSTWHVPLPWFVPFAGTERLLELGGDGAAPRSLVYRTRMAEARRRLARASKVLARAVEEDGSVTAGVDEVGRWLEEFHPGSWVELDYGGLVRLVDDEDLRDDRSVSDVAEALDSLAAGDTAPALTAYTRLTERWQGLQALERGS